jgi:hypothetical protein
VRGYCMSGLGRGEEVRSSGVKEQKRKKEFTTEVTEDRRGRGEAGEGLEVGPGLEVVVGVGGGTMEGCGGVAFSEPFGEIGAELGLESDQSLGVVGFPLINFGGDVDGGGGVGGLGEEVVDGGEHAGGIEMPFNEEAVGGKAAVERAGGDAVEIGDVTAGDGAEAIEIEVGVFCFEGIEGPFDEADVATEGVFALEEFEEAADAAIAMGREDPGHVGVEVGSGVVEADDCFGEADESVAIESAEDLAAGVMRDDEGDAGFGIEVGVTPNLAGDLDAAVEFVEGVEVADDDVWGHGS